MDAKNTNSESLARLASGCLSKPKVSHTVGSLERALLRVFPASDAESWDRTGLLVGNPCDLVAKVAFALDPTVSAIERAADEGANVLITHHPAFLNAPDSFIEAPSVSISPGAGVFAAAQRGVSLMSFHTALDVSAQAQRVLPGMLNLTLCGVLDPVHNSLEKGYGQVCLLANDESLTLAQLAARCTSVFGRAPRVWGDFSHSVSRIVTCTGGIGDLGRKALHAHADCIVCGEIKYHEALDLSQAGVAVVDVGHDTSELPLVSVLVQATQEVGVSPEHMVIVSQSDNWSYPETVRV